MYVFTAFLLQSTSAAAYSHLPTFLQIDATSLRKKKNSCFVHHMNDCKPPYPLLLKPLFISNPNTYNNRNFLPRNYYTTLGKITASLLTIQHRMLHHPTSLKWSSIPASAKLKGTPVQLSKSNTFIHS